MNDIKLIKDILEVLLLHECILIIYDCEEATGRLEHDEELFFIASEHKNHNFLPEEVAYINVRPGISTIHLWSSTHD